MSVLSRAFRRRAAPDPRPRTMPATRRYRRVSQVPDGSVETRCARQTIIPSERKPLRVPGSTDALGAVSKQWSAIKLLGTQFVT